MGWFDLGRALDTSTPGWGAAAATSPANPGLNPLLAAMLGLGQSRPTLASLSPESTPTVPYTDSPSGDTGGVADASTGFSPSITGFDPGLVGLGIQGVSMSPAAALAGAVASGLPGGRFTGSVASSLAGRAAGSLGPFGLLGNLIGQALQSGTARGMMGSNLSDANGPVAFMGPQGLTANLAAALGFGGSGPSFVGGVNVAPGVNANLDAEFAGLAPTRMPVALNGLNNLGASPNMGLYSGLGNVPSTFSGLAGQPGARMAGVAPTGEISQAANQFGARVSGGDDPDAPSVPADTSPNAGVAPDTGQVSDSGAAPSAPSASEAGIAAGEGGVGISDGGAGAGGGGGGGAGTVICTELRRQGLMDDVTWAADERFGRAQAQATRDGYRLWAQHVARGMTRSKVFTHIVACLALPWAQEMAYQMGARERGSRFGRIIMAVGLPACTWLGHFTENTACQSGTRQL